MREAALFIYLMHFLGCGDNTDAYTWGDAAQEISEAYCERAGECGLAYSYEPCVLHNHVHFCELDQTCSSAFPFESEVTACAEATRVIDCDFIYFGLLPEACGPVWEQKP